MTTRGILLALLMACVTPTGDRETLVQNLAIVHGERQIAERPAGGDSPFTAELWGNSRTGSWTILLSRDGKACIAGAGIGLPGLGKET